MDKFYTEKELIQILLAKPLDEFYGVVLHLVGQEIIFEDDEDLEHIDFSDTVIDDRNISMDNSLDDETQEFCAISSIVTVIDDQIYDVNFGTFLDIDYYHIIYYKNAAQVYSSQDFSSNTTIDMEDGTAIEKFCCDFGDNHKIYRLLDNYVTCCTSCRDITDEFLKNANSSYSYQKKMN